MNMKELRQAERMLDEYTERTERASVDGGGMCLTAYWIGGGQNLFYALDTVEEWVIEREAREGSSDE